MQQELINKKREIIGTLLKKGVLISSELLKDVDSYEHLSRISKILESKQAEDVVVGLNLNNLINDSKTQLNTLQERQEGKVNIISSYKDEPKKREPQDFIDYFNNRYKSIEKILKQRQEFKSTISINKIAYNSHLVKGFIEFPLS